MDKLVELIKEAAKRQMTPQDHYEQRVSWIYGELGLEGREVTREEVEKMLEQHGIYKPSALTADAGMERAAEICEELARKEFSSQVFDRTDRAMSACADAIRAASAQVNAVPKPLMQCSCGEPWTLNVVHRNPEPCFYWQAAPASDTSAPDAGQVVVPVKPTDEMVAAGKIVFGLMVHTGCIRPIWEMMIRAHQGTLPDDIAAMLRAAGSRQDG